MKRVLLTVAAILAVNGAIIGMAWLDEGDLLEFHLAPFLALAGLISLFVIFAMKGIFDEQDARGGSREMPGIDGLPSSVEAAARQLAAMADESIGVKFRSLLDPAGIALVMCATPVWIFFERGGPSDGEVVICIALAGIAVAVLFALVRLAGKPQLNVVRDGMRLLSRGNPPLYRWKEIDGWFAATKRGGKQTVGFELAGRRARYLPTGLDIANDKLVALLNRRLALWRIANGMSVR